MHSTSAPASTSAGTRSGVIAGVDASADQIASCAWIQQLQSAFCFVGIVSPCGRRMYFRLPFVVDDGQAVDLVVPDDVVVLRVQGWCPRRRSDQLFDRGHKLADGASGVMRLMR